jgi:voltage-gated potassium channel
MAMPSSGLFKKNILILTRYFVLAIGLAAMMVLTLPGLSTENRIWVSTALWCCWAFYALELVVRTWRGKGPHVGHSYLRTNSGVIDLLAVVPVPIVLLVGVHPDVAWLLASLWLLKLAPVVPGLSLLGRVIEQEARPLASVFVLFLIVLTLAAVALYVLESASQPDHFGSLPQSLWWAVTTLTTTGYGDAVPQTFAGRVIAGFVMICGLGLFGLWAGILATGFAAEHRRRDFVRNWELVTSVPFLRNLDAPSVIELTRLLRHLDLAANTIVVRRGRPGDCMYFISSGEVEVKFEPKPYQQGPGSIYGELALLYNSPRTATVMTTAPSTLLILDVSDFRAFTAHHPELAQEVETEAARRRAAHKDSAPHKAHHESEKRE